MSLYRIHTGGTLARHEPDGLKLYEIGHEIELEPEEAARLNEGRSLANSRVVKVGGETETTTPRPIRESPEVVRIEVSTPGTPGPEELIAIGASHVLSESDAEILRKVEEFKAKTLILSSLPLDARVEFTDDPPTPVAHIAEPAAEQSVDQISSPQDVVPLGFDESVADVAPDWATYLAAVSAAEAAEALRGLESTDDVQAALDAEAAGLRRPLVIRAGNAAIRKLRKS